MRSYLFLLVASCLSFLIGCRSSVSKSDIVAFGEQRFITNVLQFRKSQKVPEVIQKEFSPERVEKHLNGVLLVFSESERSIEGIYVDESDVAGWGGSGLDVEPWFSQVAWVRI